MAAVLSPGPPKCDDDCVPHPHAGPGTADSASSLVLASLPFILTFAFVSIVVLHRLFPALCGGRPSSSTGPGSSYSHSHGHGHNHNHNHSHSHGVSPERSRVRRRLSAIAFSTTLGATAVLAELVLCEVGGWANGAACRAAFRVVVGVLLLCLLVVTPLLEIHSFVEARGWGSTSWRRRTALVAGGFVLWLWLFWSFKMPAATARAAAAAAGGTLSEEALARVGVVGVSLMALLAGFGCVSTPWQHFGGGKPRTVADTDLARAAGGLQAASELLAGKRAKLRVLEKKMYDRQLLSGSSPPPPPPPLPGSGGLGLGSGIGLVAKVFSAVDGVVRSAGGFGGDADSQEHAVLLTEISGLDTMRVALAAELAELQCRFAAQHRARSPLGRLLRTTHGAFALYCVYRLAATALARLPLVARRHPPPPPPLPLPLASASEEASFSQSDPINNILAVLAVYWDPHLDRAAWSRQISFLLSGVIIAGSLGSVRTTLAMVMRLVPAGSPATACSSTSAATATATAAAATTAATSTTAAADANANASASGIMPLFVSQLSAVYVLASALLLRSSLPASVGSVISQSLGTPLDPAFVDHWFDSLFLCAAAATALVIFVLRRVRGGHDCSADDLESGAGTKES